MKSTDQKKSEAAGSKFVNLGEAGIKREVGALVFSTFLHHLSFQDFSFLLF